jgi:hypothetical protein
MDIAPAKSLESSLPDGQIVDRTWLKKQGFSRPRVDSYLRSGALQAVARGAYRKPGPPLKWEHVVYSLQELGCPVHLGGRSALELAGMAHYLRLGDVQTISLYGTSHLPLWVDQVATDYRLEGHNPKLFSVLPQAVLVTRPFGHWDWLLRYASLELAFLELFAEIATATDFEVADKLFEAATTLRPELVRTLLLHCTNVKAKRLFLWFGERHQHPWQSVLNTSGIDLGSGKRMLIRGGVLDKRFHISVPRKMADEFEENGTEANGTDANFF